MKYLILVGDGMGDHPIAELDGRTPLQAAVTPAMDRLCARASLFEVATVPESFHPGSDVANMSLLGCDPSRYYTGRAPLEAASMGIDLAADETAFRCNLVTLAHTGGRTEMIDFSAGHIPSAEAAELIEAIQRECGNSTFRFYPGISYRHLLVARDPVPDIDALPPHDYIGKEVTDAWCRYLDSSAWRDLVTGAARVLADHPVNRRRVAGGMRPATSIWPWGCGKMPDLPSLRSRFGVTGTMISAVDLLNGLGVCVGLGIARVDGATGYIDTNYEGKARAALEALKDRDFVYVHLEAPDEAGHQGRLDHKILAIEDFDRRIVDPITKSLEQAGVDFRVVVTMDHFTPLALKTHTAEPVPALLYDSRRVAADTGVPFDERLLVDHRRNLSRVAGHNLVDHLFERQEA